MHEFGIEEWWHTVIVSDQISAKQQPVNVEKGSSCLDVVDA